MPADPEGGCKHMGGEDAYPTNPKKGHSYSARKICIPPEDASTGDKNMHGYMEPDEPHRYVNINLDINYLHLKNLST